jgi:hypothetical protein
MNSFYPNSYYKNPKEYKRCMIKGWKQKGVVYADFDELYAVYINTLTCSHCSKEFKNSRDRHLDHCHETGLFRKIVCSGCNNKDSYLKYPPHFTSKDKQKQMDSEIYYIKQDTILEQKKEYYKANRDTIIEKNKKRYEANRDKYSKKGNCFFCDKHIIIKGLRQHYKLGRCVIKPIT